jgi:quercetin dioxygenase-like cupin family protein
VQAFGNYRVLAHHEFPECSLRLLRLDVGQASAAHTHARCVQSYLVLEGVAQVRVGTTYHRLARGEAVRIPAGTVHGVEPLDGPIVVLSVSVPPLRADDHFPESPTDPPALP